MAEPGRYFTGTVGEQRILVVKGQDGIIRAFYNVCQHRNHDLLKKLGTADAKVEGRVVIKWGNVAGRNSDLDRQKRSDANSLAIDLGIPYDAPQRSLHAVPQDDLHLSLFRKKLLSSF